ncbi:MAG: hypothetical protein ACJAUP_002136 [Cellvibrionaceae bacterium]
MSYAYCKAQNDKKPFFLCYRVSNIIYKNKLMTRSAINSNIVLIIGSAPDALRVRECSLGGVETVVAINNAWQIRDDWDYLVYPDDLPLDRLPPAVQPHQHTINSESYVPAQNRFGGFVYAGGTMCLTAAYWALATLKPSAMAFIGCDMVYPKDSPTHFYGEGSADPLRDDITLQSLEAKSTRLQYAALENNCLCINLTSLDESRLIFPKASIGNVLGDKPELNEIFLTTVKEDLYARIECVSCRESIEAIRAKELELAYYVDSGKYWEHLAELNADDLRLLDESWLNIYDSHLK